MSKYTYIREHVAGPQIRVLAGVPACIAAENDLDGALEELRYLREWRADEIRLGGDPTLIAEIAVQIAEMRAVCRAARAEYDRVCGM